MPKETWFWVVIAVFVAALAALAIWKNGGVDVLVGPKGLVFKTRPSKESNTGSVRAASGAIDKVGEDANIGGEVGSIIGSKSAIGDLSSTRSTEVGKRMTIGKGGKVGEIIGTRIEGQKEQGR